MRIVGILLIAALMVLPVVAANRVAWSLRSTFALSMLLGVSSVIADLVSNALRYTPPGGTIVLGGRLKTNDERLKTKEAEGAAFVLHPSSFVVLDVRDTGVGIAAEHLPAIFERFYRADPSRQEATGGSGLGLAIVKSIVEAHGGQVEIASTPGQGTAITIALPLQVEP